MVRAVSFGEFSAVSLHRTNNKQARWWWRRVDDEIVLEPSHVWNQINVISCNQLCNRCAMSRDTWRSKYQEVSSKYISQCIELFNLETNVRQLQSQIEDCQAKLSKCRCQRTSIHTKNVSSQTSSFLLPNAESESVYRIAKMCRGNRQLLPAIIAECERQNISQRLRLDASNIASTVNMVAAGQGEVVSKFDVIMDWSDRQYRKAARWAARTVGECSSESGSSDDDAVELVVEFDSDDEGPQPSEQSEGRCEELVIEPEINWLVEESKAAPQSTASNLQSLPSTSQSTISVIPRLHVTRPRPSSTSDSLTIDRDYIVDERRGDYICISGRRQHRCDRPFKTLSHLKYHVNAHHRNIRYKCPICDALLITRQTVIKHCLNCHQEAFKGNSLDAVREQIEMDSIEMIQLTDSSSDSA